MNTASERFERLTRLEVIERSAREGTLHALLVELDGCVSALGTDPRADTLRAIRTALRIDLAFLVEHPEDAFACLYHRLAWHKAPGARAYYELRLGELAPRPALEGACAGDHPLHRTLREWRAQKDTSGAPWLRSLRPAEIGLRGALLEEYRADVPEHFRRVRLVDDGRSIELAYGTRLDRPDDTPFVPRPWNCLAWDRTTGRRESSVIDVFNADVSPDARFRIEHSNWGRADLVARESGRTLGSFGLGDSYNASAVAYASGANIVALSGWDDDGGGFVAVYDLTTRAQLKQLHVDSALFELAISARGERVAASGSNVTYVWELRDGRQIKQLPLRKAAVGFSPDARLLLTAEPGVMRVWSLDQESTFLRGYRDGLSNATFSPNGDRLVTGSWLSDARTGALVAHVDFESIEYFAGGPPRNAFLLGDERLTCLKQGVAAWDAKTGVKLSSDPSRRYGHGQAVALTPDAKRYAKTAWTSFTHSSSSRNVRVVVRDVDSGELLTEFIAPPVTCIAWAPDGRVLATGSVDGQVRLWDGVRGVLLSALSGGAKARISDLAFLHGGAYVVAGTEADALRVWRLDSGELVFSRPLADGDRVMTISERGAKPRSYYTWIASTEALDAVNSALHLAERRDDPSVAITSKAGCLSVIDRATGMALASFPASERMVAHPREPIWAGGPVHLRFEGHVHAR